ncbi:glutathione S-transferase C-terminal domain-containing protein [Luteolibacter sp. GHJ8]|uniref:Glutathione S-transferase C-terminal domain-containing protein n=1 Tax=Luteolibacter rhizosphaerae TaxID=2989719 RepID=A0ABT3G8R3_9BACT|nr:glutathione S-transferase C-terminal domain-containing protein [Luteolibacter rhizosphaerae]MCW1915886.1 glutathione S-transferase C-terminal domain-containing protein [Luteolibacter rhizosphaerae]
MAQFPDESKDGAFERQEDAFRRIVGKDEDLPAIPGRYHLYVSLACPWAHRTLIVRSLLGLKDAIGISIADPVRDERGWAFHEGAGHGPDEAEGFRFLMEAYRASDPTFDGRVTVPVLWDRLEKRIVNNSEDDICRMFQDSFAGPEAPNLFPAQLAAEQEALSRYLYENVNNGVYEAGFATRQDVYEMAARQVFAALDELEKRLQGSKYLLGEVPVESDWRLFCTLVRFDAVYHGHFKCNLRRILDYPALSRHLNDLHGLPGIAETVNLDHIKRHYYVTHDDINPTRIVPVGPAVVFAG